MTKRNICNYAGHFMLFMLFWIAVSGSLRWQELLLGAVAAVFVVYFNRNLLVNRAERPPVNWKTLYIAFGYVFRLLLEIIKANLQVVRVVLHPRMPIAPRLIPLPVELERPVDRLILANSITLTPGTLTVLAEENRFWVHALTREAAEGVAQWELIKMLMRLEEGAS
ncbi:MAG: Na+/H+ antiporter subunit E [Bacillota bacterium]